MSNLTSTAWWAAAGTRAIKTAAQTAVALIGTGAVGFTDLDWVRIASVSGVAAVLSLLTSLEGLPEVDTDAAAATVVATESTTATAGAAATTDTTADGKEA